MIELSLRWWRWWQYGCDGLFDRRRGKPSPRRVPVETSVEMLGIYHEHYHDFNVRHFHEKRRARKPLPGMLLHLDGSRGHVAATILHFCGAVDVRQWAIRICGETPLAQMASKNMLRSLCKQ